MVKADDDCARCLDLEILIEELKQNQLDVEIQLEEDLQEAEEKANQFEMKLELVREKLNESERAREASGKEGQHRLNQAEQREEEISAEREQQKKRIQQLEISNEKHKQELRMKAADLEDKVYELESTAEETEFLKGEIEDLEGFIGALKDQMKSLQDELKSLTSIHDKQTAERDAYFEKSTLNYKHLLEESARTYGEEIKNLKESLAVMENKIASSPPPPAPLKAIKPRTVEVEPTVSPAMLDALVEDRVRKELVRKQKEIEREGAEKIKQMEMKLERMSQSLYAEKKDAALGRARKQQEKDIMQTLADIKESGEAPVSLQQNELIETLRENSDTFHKTSERRAEQYKKQQQYTAKRTGYLAESIEKKLEDSRLRKAYTQQVNERKNLGKKARKAATLKLTGLKQRTDLSNTPGTTGRGELSSAKVLEYLQLRSKMLQEKKQERQEMATMKKAFYE